MHIDGLAKNLFALVQLVNLDQGAGKVHAGTEEVRRELRGIAKHSRRKPRLAEIPGNRTHQARGINVLRLLAQHLAANIFGFAEFPGAVMFHCIDKLFAFRVDLERLIECSLRILLSVQRFVGHGKVAMRSGVIRRQFNDAFVALDCLVALALGDQRIAKFALRLGYFREAGNDIAQLLLGGGELVLPDQHGAKQYADLVVTRLLYQCVTAQACRHFELTAAKVGKGEIEHLLIMGAVTDGGVLVTSTEHW